MDNWHRGVDKAAVCCTAGSRWHCQGGRASGKDVDNGGVAHRLFTLRVLARPRGRGVVAAVSTLCYSRPALWEEPRETNLSAKDASPPPGAWVSCAHAHAGRSPHTPAPPCEREASADRLRVGEVGAVPSVGRLTRSEEFRRVYESGTHRAGVLVVLHTCPNSLGTVRVGVPVGRRFGTAVARNRLKRRLREAVRSHRPRMKPGVDLVVVPRTAAGTASYAEIRNGVGAALEAAGVLTGDNRREAR